MIPPHDAYCTTRQRPTDCTICSPNRLGCLFRSNISLIYPFRSDIRVHNWKVKLKNKTTWNQLTRQRQAGKWRKHLIEYISVCDESFKQNSMDTRRKRSFALFEGFILNGKVLLNTKNVVNLIFWCVSHRLSAASWKDSLKRAGDGSMLNKMNVIGTSVAYTTVPPIKLQSENDFLTNSIANGSP